MTDNTRNIPLAESLDEIKQLEEKLVRLKRHLLHTSSATLSRLMADGEFTSFLITAACNRRFAIPVAGIEEVIEMVSAIPLGDPVRGVIGLINYHGELIALFDLAEIAGLGKNEVSAEKIVVICIMEDKRFAVMADEAADVISVPKTQIHFADQVMSGLMREIAVIQVERDTAAVVDLWSAFLALPLREPDGVQHSSDDIAGPANKDGA
jgi:chemotaxis signal transduction protein